MASAASCFLTMDLTEFRFPDMFSGSVDRPPHVLLDMLLDAAAANPDFCRLVGVDPVAAAETFEEVKRVCGQSRAVHSGLRKFLCDQVGGSLVVHDLFNAPSGSPFDHAHAFVFVSAAVAANPTITAMHLTAYRTPRPCPVLFLTRDSLVKLRIGFDVSCVSVGSDPIMRGLAQMRRLETINLAFAASNRADLPHLNRTLHDAVTLLTQFAPPSLIKLRIVIFDFKAPQLPLRWTTPLPATLQGIRLFGDAESLLEQGLLEAIVDSCPRLQSLECHSQPAGQSSTWVSRLLRRLADRLQCLTLSHGLDSNLVATIGSMLKLRKLHIRNQFSLRFADQQHVAATVDRHSALESLHFSNCNLTDDEFATVIRGIAGANTFRKLAEICINAPERFGSMSTAAISDCFLRHGAVRKLEISGSHLGDTGMLAILADGLRATSGSLQHLSINAPVASLRTYRALSETLAQCPSLQRVSLGAARFMLSAGASLTTTRAWFLSDCDEELAYVLTPLIPTLHLREVTLSLITSRPLLDRQENMPASSEAVARLMHNRALDTKHRAAWEVVRAAICRMQERRVATGHPLSCLFCQLPNVTLRTIGEFTAPLEATPFVLN